MNPETLLTARNYLHEIVERYPGGSIELRVPFAGAIQCFDVMGASHRRGTPPNTVEVDVTNFVALCEGDVTYDELERSGQLMASGRDVALIKSVFPL